MPIAMNEQSKGPLEVTKKVIRRCFALLAPAIAAKIEFQIAPNRSQSIVKDSLAISLYCQPISLFAVSVVDTVPDDE